MNIKVKLPDHVLVSSKHILMDNEPVNACPILCPNLNSRSQLASSTNTHVYYKNIYPSNILFTYNLEDAHYFSSMKANALYEIMVTLRSDNRP